MPSGKTTVQLSDTSSVSRQARHENFNLIHKVASLNLIHVDSHERTAQVLPFRVCDDLGGGSDLTIQVGGSRG